MQLDSQLLDIIADENARVGWRDYGEHIRKGGAQDLAAKVSMQIAMKAYTAAIDACLKICGENDTAERAANDLRDYRIHVTGEV